MKCKVCGEQAVQSEREPGLWVHFDDEIIMNLFAQTAERTWDHEVILDVIEARLIESKPASDPEPLSLPALPLPEPPGF